MLFTIHSMNTTKLYLASLVCRILPETRCFELKRKLYRWCGAQIGKNTKITSSVVIIGSGKLSVGENVWIGHNSTIVCSNEVRIGNNVDIAPRVYIGDGTHEIDRNGAHVAGKGISGPVIINDGCWICTNTTILPFTTIVEKTILAASSTAKGNVPAHEIWGGCLAHKIRSI